MLSKKSIFFSKENQIKKISKNTYRAAFTRVTLYKKEIYGILLKLM
jgi:hypothetical protein